MTRLHHGRNDRFADFAVAARHVLNQAVHGRLTATLPWDDPTSLLEPHPSWPLPVVRTLSDLTTGMRAEIVTALGSGKGLRWTARRTGVTRNIIGAWLTLTGDAYKTFLDRALRDLPTSRLRVVRTPMFQLKPSQALASAKARSDRSVWMWTCLDAQSTLVITWRVGLQSEDLQADLLSDASRRLVGRAVVETVDGVDESASLRSDDTHLMLHDKNDRSNIDLGPRDALLLAKQQAAFSFYATYHNYGRAMSRSHDVTPAMAAGLAERIWEPHDFAAHSERLMANGGSQRPSHNVGS